MTIAIEVTAKSCHCCPMRFKHFLILVIAALAGTWFYYTSHGYSALTGPGSLMESMHASHSDRIDRGFHGGIGPVGNPYSSSNP